MKKNTKKKKKEPYVGLIMDVSQRTNKLQVPEIRVWRHLNSALGDFYCVFDTFEKALAFIKKHKDAEEAPLIAFRGFEINLWTLK